MPQTLDQIFQSYHDITTNAKKTEAEAAIPTVTAKPFKPTAQLSSNYQGDVNKARIANVTNPALNKNPLQFQNSTDRQAATLARVQHLMSTPQYKAMAPDKQTRFRAFYYDKFVAPAYTSGGFKAPDKQLWVDRIIKSGYAPSDFYQTKNMKQAVNTYAGVQKTAGDIFAGAIHAGVYLNKEESLAHLGLYNFFHRIIGESVDVKEEDQFKKQIDLTQAKINNISDDVSDSATFWLQTHPSKSWVDKMDSQVGEQLLQLPLYGGIGAVREATAGALENAGKMQNLTQWLKASPKGAFAIRRLGDAFDGYLGSVLQNQSSEEKRDSIIGFMGFGAASEGVTSAGLKVVASLPLIKKWTAETLLAGGRPLQQAVTDQAAHELANGIVGGIKFDPSDPDYLTKARARLDEVMGSDPIHSKLVYGEKITLNSLSHTNFGTTYGKLTKDQQFKIRALRKESVAQTIDEAPVHLPDVADKHAVNILDEQKRLDPGFKESVDAFEKEFGIKVSDSVLNAEVEGIKSQTGIKSSQGAIGKTAKASAFVERRKTETQAKAKIEEPKKLAQLQDKFVAYLKKPTGKLAAPQSKLDMRNYLADMSNEDFAQELHAQLGNHWFFENPQHLMTWAWQYHDLMPKGFSAKLKDVLDDIDPTGTPASWTVQAHNMSKHLKQLATTGQLYREGNIFRSSNFSGKPTKWQRQLEQESIAIEKKQLAAKMGPLKRNHKSQFEASLKMLDDVQAIVRPKKGGN